MSELSFQSPHQAYLLRAAERIAVGLGTCALLITIFASWSSPGLRPVTGYSVGSEHVLAFAAIGGCWGFAYPRRAVQLAVLLALIAIVIEVGQLFVPGRHARLIDIATKIAGGVAGVFVAHIFRKFIERVSLRGKTLA